MAKVLIIEDEKEMAGGLKDLLEYENHYVAIAEDGRRGLELYRREQPDILILDLMLPDMDGFEVCKEIRKDDRKMPILMLTARSLEQDIVRGFEAGADDYVTKPFSVAELLARINAILRRASLKSEEDNRIIAIGECSIDTGKMVLKRGKEEIPLTFYEVEILKYMYDNKNQALSRESIYQNVWGVERDPTNRTVDNFIVKLRKKIEKDQKKPQYLITVYGLGYKLLV